MRKILLLTIGIVLLSASGVQAQQDDSPHRIKRNGKWGYADDKGNEVIPCKYNHAFPFYESDLALVESEGKFGYIDKRGKVEIPLQYAKAYPFSDERAAVKKNGKYGFVTSYGYEVIKPRYSDVKWGFIDGYAWVKKGCKKNGKWGMIGKYGTTFVDFNYINLSYFDPNTGAADAVTKDGVIHYYLKGKRYPSKKERDAVVAPVPVPDPKPTPTPQKPLFVWNDLPSSTTSPQMTVSVEIQSESEITSCDLYLKEGNSGSKGSHVEADIIESPKNGGFSKTLSRTFTLREDVNTIVVEATNAAGSYKEERTIKYVSPEPPTIVWEGDYPDKTTKEQLLVKARISSKSDVSWKLTVTSSGTTKGSYTAKDIDESSNSGTGCNVSKSVKLMPGYNTITLEVTNASGKKTESKKVWYSPCEKRIALVIGNANYRRVENLGRFGKLQNPINDAISIYKELESCGFDMMPIVKNANLKTMQESINAFIDKANKEHYEVAFIYYSGHGVSPSIEKREKQESFFIPLIEEDSIAYIEDLAKYAIDANRLIEDLNNKTDCRIKIAMLDCCRSCNLASRAKGPMALKGMNPLNVPFGEQIFFAARYKEAALDYINRDDTNSPFVTAFLQCFREYPNYKWEDLVKKVILKVHELTGTYQEPKAEGTLKGDFYLNPYHDKP
ncbi:MAG: WG repeat-containing protein [Bacteroidales bacterium]|nr:WG repeat-containing protein [Bacteroidales bacterium]